MKILNFLKPTMQKMGVFILLSILLRLVAWYVAFYYAGSQSIFGRVLYASIDFGLSVATWLQLPGTYLLNNLYSLPYWYLIACIIAWAYHKFRNRPSQARK